MNIHIPYKIVIGFVVIAVFATGIAYREKREKERETLNVGALLILSGDSASWGESAKRGIDLAVEEINSEGGINGRPINIIAEDTGGETKNAVLAYKKFKDDKRIKALIGPLWQAEISAIAPMAANDMMPIVAPSYAPLANRPNPRNPLLIWMDPTTESTRMADYIYGQGIRKVSAIGTKDPWEKEVTETFVERFKSLGGNVVFEELMQPDARDARSTVTKALAPQPDAIFIGTFFQFVPTLKDIWEAKYGGKLYGIEVDSYLANQTKAYSDALQFIAPDFYADAFAKKFEEQYGEKPGIPAGQAYDSMKILASVMRGARDNNEILKRMENLREYEGASGRITFTPDYKTLLPTAIFELKNGEAKRIKPI